MYANKLHNLGPIGYVSRDAVWLILVQRANSPCIDRVADNVRNLWILALGEAEAPPQRPVAHVVALLILQAGMLVASSNTIFGAKLRERFMCEDSYDGGTLYRLDQRRGQRSLFNFRQGAVNATSTLLAQPGFAHQPSETGVSGFGWRVDEPVRIDQRGARINNPDLV